VTVERDMDVALIARLAEVEEADFRALNPSLKQPLVMAAGTPNVLLPWDNAVIFQRNLKLHDGPLASWTAWVVPTTMTVAQAAKQVGVSEAELRKANAIPPRMRLRAGSSLIVPRNGKLDRDVPAHVADNGMLSLQPEVTTRRVVVKARKGETVSRLASRYGVSAASVAQWNRLSAGSTLKTGQRVTLHLPQRAKATTSARSTKPVKPRATSSKTASSKKPTIKKSSTAKAPSKKTARQ
jgi:membrane-bound lytic murein transglycosylase D